MRTGKRNKHYDECGDDEHAINARTNGVMCVARREHTAAAAA